MNDHILDRGIARPRRGNNQAASQCRVPVHQNDRSTTYIGLGLNINGDRHPQNCDPEISVPIHALLAENLRSIRSPWDFQIDRHMCSIEVTGDNDLFSSSMQFITDLKQAGIKVQFIFHAFFTALTIREVNVI